MLYRKVVCKGYKERINRKDACKCCMLYGKV